MKKIFVMFLALIVAQQTMAKNPVIPHPYTADPSIHRWENGRFYIYGSHDKDNPKVWDMADYHVFSSDDMVNWTDHGVVLHNTQTPWGGPFWAPDAAERDGHYYLYFPEGNKICVAESTSPIGPFHNPKVIYHMPQGYVQAYDPAVFEYKGKDYIIISERKSKTTPFYPVIFELDETMMSIKEGSKRELPTMQKFHEGPFIFFRNDKVYMLGGGGKTLRYWMADDLFGKYEFKGDILSGNDEFTISKTAHGSVIKVEGQWYLAYHYDVEQGNPYKRTTCIDYLEFREDGTIIPITPTKAGIKAFKQNKIKADVADKREFKPVKAQNTPSQALIINLPLKEKKGEPLPSALMQGKNKVAADVVYCEERKRDVRQFMHNKNTYFYQLTSAKDGKTLIGNNARTYSLWANVKRQMPSFKDASKIVPQGNAQLLYIGGGTSGYERFNIVVSYPKGIIRLIVDGGGGEPLKFLDFEPIGVDIRDSWHHISVVVPQGAMSNQIKCYVDGKSCGAGKLSTQKGETLAPVALNTKGNAVNIGQDMVGSISDVRLYNKALSQAEIQQVINETK